MSAYYRLSDQYLLRGWEKLPYALVDSRTGDVDFISKPMMETLLKCDGNWDFESPLTSERHRECAAKLLSKDRIVACEPGAGIAPQQQYRFHDNRYMQAVHWSITGRCNYRCKHCFMSAPEARYADLSHEACMEIARQISACGIYKVSLSGGEPLARPDFMEIAAELSRQGIVITQLHTNGALLDSGVLDGFESLGQKPDIFMSFDGVGFHDWMRGTPGAEKAVDAAFELCARRGFRALARMCAYRGNLESLRETVNHLASVGCSDFLVGCVNELGDWLRNGAGQTPAYEEYVEACLRYIPQYYEDGMPLPLTLSGVFATSPSDPMHYTFAPHHPGFVSESRLLFACARPLLQIYPDGRPAICDALGPDFVGMPPMASDDDEQETASLADVLSTGSAYMEFMDMRCASFHSRNAECRECPYLRICGGGCRAFAYQASGTIFEKDPQTCKFFRDGWAEKVVNLLRAVRPEATSPLKDDPLFQGERP